MKRIGILCLAVVLALGTLGVAYAPWTDEVEIMQTVQTGSLEIGVYGEATWDEEKDVMDVTVTHGTFKFQKDGEDFYDSVTVTISNMYPCVWVNETFEIAIGGTVPVHLYPEFELDDEDGLFDEESMTIEWEILKNGVVLGQGEGLDDLAEVLSDHQAYPCEIITININKHLKQFGGANQDLDGSFTIKIVAMQYNNCEKEPPVCREETAFGGDFDMNVESPGAWWYYYWDGNGAPQEQGIWAGKYERIGTVTVSKYNDLATISMVLNAGWELQDDDESVKIQGYETFEELPENRPPSGKLRTYKGNELTITIPYFPYYVIHLDVQFCE